MTGPTLYASCCVWTICVLDCPRRLSAEWTYWTYMDERRDIRSFDSATKLFSTMACPADVLVPQQNNACDCGLFVIRVRHCAALLLLRPRGIRADKPPRMSLLRAVRAALLR